MYSPTGRPRGRPPGSPNKRSTAIKKAVAAAAQRLEAEIPGAFVGDAHAFLISIYKNPEQPLGIRIDAAGKAIKYEKPALAAVEMSATVKRDADDLSDAELAAIIAEGRGDIRRH